MPINYKDVRDELIAAQKAQIEQQEKIIRFQEETIEILNSHNNELMELIDKFAHS